jgi:hypothetical protein
MAGPRVADFGMRHGYLQSLCWPQEAPSRLKLGVGPDDPRRVPAGRCAWPGLAWPQRPPGSAQARTGPIVPGRSVSTAGEMGGGPPGAMPAGLRGYRATVGTGRSGKPVYGPAQPDQAGTHCSRWRGGCVFWPTQNLMLSDRGVLGR